MSCGSCGGSGPSNRVQKRLAKAKALHSIVYDVVARDGDGDKTKRFTDEDEAVGYQSELGGPESAAIYARARIV